MSKVLRTCAVAVAASLAVPLWGVPSALADDTTLIPSQGAYFNADGLRKPDESPQAPPNVTSDYADGVAKEHLAVAARGGNPSKVSFLLFDLFEIDPEATVSKAVLSVKLAPNDQSNNSYGHTPEKVAACAAGDEGFGADDGTSMQDAPSRKCEVFTTSGKASADGSSYEFDITELAQTWLTVNDGVALAPAEGAVTTPFQVVFRPATEAKLALTYTPSAGSDDASLDAPIDADFGAVADGGSTDLGGSFDSGTATEPDAGLGAAESPVLTADVPVEDPVAADPAAAEPEIAAGAGTVPVSSMTSAPLAPSPAFWGGMLLLVGLLALLSLIMGDNRTPQTAVRQSRLSQALQARERAAGSGARSRPALGH